MNIKPAILMLGLATSLALCGCTTARNGIDQQSHWFKGWYLWTWQNDEGEWLCTLRPGTNWLPTEETVKAKAMPWNELQPMIDHLQPGESVFWHGLYQAPPVEIRNRIAQMCEARGVILAP